MCAPSAGSAASEIAVIVVNYRQPAATLDCLASLYTNAGTNFQLFLVDNAPDPAMSALLTAGLAERAVTRFTNAGNLGFAAACNQALAVILADRRFGAVALLNNDTLVEPGWLARLAERLDPARGIGMAACRMLAIDTPDRIDNLGIALYRSGIASNRQDPAAPLLGPCGGGALYTAELLRAVRAVAGHVFDPDFFCYAEDTDLALRARALGYECAFVPDAVLRHHGQLASGGGYNAFVAYHGLRNSLFAMVKNLPAGFLWRNLGWILLMQCAVAVKYPLMGQPGLAWRVWRDVLRALPRLRRQRQRILARAVWRPDAWRGWTCPRFYDRAYVARTLRTLWRREARVTG